MNKNYKSYTITGMKHNKISVSKSTQQTPMNKNAFRWVTRRLVEIDLNYKERMGY